MADLYDDVVGDAIARAVRRAVDDVGRAPSGELDRAVRPAHPEPVEAELDRPLPRHTRKQPLEAPSADALARRHVPPPPEVDDPYEVLGVPRGASWEGITSAHRRLARAWHPDGAPEGERELRDDLIRRLNVAYAELRVRRGR